MVTTRSKARKAAKAEAEKQSRRMGVSTLVFRILLAPIFVASLVLALTIASPRINDTFTNAAFSEAARSRLPARVINWMAILTMVRTGIYCKLDYIGCIKDELARTIVGVNMEQH